MIKPLLDTSKIALLVIDVQGRLAERVIDAKQNLTNTIQLVNLARCLSLKTFYVEHCADKLGHTAHELLCELSHATALHKDTFSAWHQPHIQDALNNANIDHIVVCGMECHVCVYQTVIDLLNSDFNVSVVRNAVASQREIDFDAGLNAMQQAGANIVTTEMLVFDLMKAPDHPAFRDVLNYLKD